MYFVLCKLHYTALQCSTVMAFIYRDKSYPPFQWYGGALLAILENSSVTNKGTKVQTNVYSEYCCLHYKTSHAIACVRIVTWATVCWFVTNKLGRPPFWVQISTVELKQFTQDTLITKQYCRQLLCDCTGWDIVSRAIASGSGNFSQQALLLRYVRFCQLCCWRVLLFASCEMWRTTGCFGVSCCLHLQG